MAERAARLAVRRLARKLASRHDWPMRRLLLVTLVLFIAACARAPRAVEPSPAPVDPGRPSGALIGLTASDLAGRFGQPSFQVREGAGTKLQWSDGRCVLDAYLYLPESGRGVERVVHLDARRPSGEDYDVESCLNLLTR
jgi:nitrous oxide reductase accessory protein NosL